MPFSAPLVQNAPLKPGDGLRKCVPWPTMQWLPQKPFDALAKCLRELEEDGFNTTRVELVCALILACNPRDPSLLSDLRSYKARYSRTRPSGRPTRGVPLMLRMPSPITLRLDLLVRSLSESTQRIYRHELIGTLITRAAEDLPRAEAACLAYRKAPARAAAVPGYPRRCVLAQDRPRPGARSS